MARRRKRGELKAGTCPICQKKMSLVIEHVKRKHPEVYKRTKKRILLEALEKFDLSDDDKLYAAKELFDKKDYEPVFEILKDVSPKFKDLATVFSVIGRALNEQRSHDEAEYYLHRAIDLEPKVPEFHLYLAIAYLGNRKTTLAIEELDGIDIDKAVPNNKKLIFELKKVVNAEIEQKQIEFDINRDQFLKVNSLFMEGLAKLKSGDYKECIKIYEKILAIQPKSYSAYGNIGLAHMKLGNYKKARDNFRMALSINPVYALGQDNLYILEKWEKGDRVGVGVSLKLLKEDEKAIIPETELMTDDHEFMMHSHAFYKVNDIEKVINALEESDEFEITKRGNNFLEAIWSRENLEMLMIEDLPPGVTDPRSILGDILLRWDDLKLSTVSRGRLKVLENILLEKCKLNNAIELGTRFFEEVSVPDEGD